MSSTTQYAELDEFIDFQLQKTRQGIKTVDIATAICGAVVFVLGYLLIFVVCDHWLITDGFGPAARIGLLSLLTLATLGWLTWKIVLPAVRQVNRLYAARTLEGHSPELHSNLLNWVDLKSAGREVSPLILRSIEKRAAVALSHADVDEAVDRRPLLHWLYAMLAVVTVFCGYAVFSPKKVGPSIWRALLPASDVQVATQTQILKVEPGTTEVMARTQLEVMVELAGDEPDRVDLFFTSDDQRQVDQVVELRASEEGLKRYRGLILGENGDGLLQSIEYYVRAGDARSETYRVTVIQPPSATITELEYQFPKYMKRSKESAPGPNVDTYEGTQVTFRATTNMPIESAVLQFSDTEKFTSKGEEQRMDVKEGTQLSTRWAAKFRSDGTYPKFYRMQVKTKAGQVDPAPSVHSITLKPDLPPEIEIVAPKGDLEVPANAIIPIVLKARDQDFSLSVVEMHIQRAGQPFDKNDLYRGDSPETEVQHDWRLGNLDLKVDDVLTYWFVVRDNKEPTPNYKDSPRRKITIKDRIPEEDAKKQNEQDKEKIKLEQQQQREAQNGDQPQQPNENGAQNENPSDNANNQNQNENQTGDADKPPRDDKKNDSNKNNEDGQDGNKGDNKNADSKNDGGKTGEKPSPTDKGNDTNNQDAGKTGNNGDKKSEKPLDKSGRDDDEVLRRALERQRDKNKPDGASGDQSKDPMGNDGTKPDTTKPNGDKQDGTKPDGSKPDGTKPDGMNSDGSKPEGTKPEGTKPDGMKPEGTKPDGGKPEGTKPDGSKPDGNKPEGTKPDGGKPEGTKPEGQDADGSKQDSSKQDGSKQDGAKQDGSKSDGSKQDGTKPDGAKPEKSKSDGSKQDGSKSDGSKSDGSKQDGSKSDGAKSDGSKADGSKSDGSKQDGSKSDGSKSDGSKQDASKSDGSKSDGSKQDGSKPDGSKSDGSKGDGSKSDGSKQDGSKSDGAKQDGAKQDGSKQDGSKQEGSKSEGSKQDGSKPDGGKQEGSKQEGGKQEGAKQDGSSKDGSKSDGAKPSENVSGEAGKQSQEGPRHNLPQGTKREGGEADPLDSKNRNQSGEGAGNTADDAEPANLEDKLKATNLVLDRLKKDLERGEVDDEFLKELGWTKEDMQRFVDRLDKQMKSGKDDTPAEQVRRRQFEEMLKSLDLNAKGDKRQDSNTTKRSTSDFSDRRAPVPVEYNKATEEYTKRLAKQKKPAAPANNKK